MNQTFSIKKALSEAWHLSCREWPILVGLSLAYTVILTILSMILIGHEIINFASSILIFILFNIGIIHVGLKIIREEIPSIKSFSEILPIFFKVLIVGIITLIGAMIGFMLFIIPGFIFLARISCAIYILVDNPSISAIEAIKRSFSITKGHVWHLIGIWIISMLLLLVGILALFIGLFFAFPLTSMFMTVAYIMFTKHIKQSFSNRAN